MFVEGCNRNAGSLRASGRDAVGRDPTKEVASVGEGGQHRPVEQGTQGPAVESEAEEIDRAAVGTGSVARRSRVRSLEAARHQSQTNDETPPSQA